MTRFLLCLLLACVPAYGATKYVDSAATGANNGSSWTDAWTTLAAMTGVSSGDTVYISGGPAGSTRTYSTTTNVSYPSQWLNVVNGATYQIGQDSAHNGTAVFDAGGSTSYWLVQNWQNVTISGDAGDGARHFRLTGCDEAGAGGGWVNVRITYVDFPTIKKGIDHNPCLGPIEIDHCRFDITSNNSADHLSYGSFTAASFDQNKFHDNLCYVPYKASLNGDGADCLQWNGSGYSIYNNTITAVSSSTYTGTQHQDGWQSTGASASKIKIYGNLFVNIVNYPIYAEALFGGFTDLYVYNNIAVSADFTGTQAFVISGNSSNPATNVVCANNLAVNFANPFTFRNPSASPSASTFFSCYFYNNCYVGGTNIIDSNVASATNVSRTTLQAATDFQSFTAGSTSNNYHLVAGASTLIGTGTNASALIGSLDKDGLTRVAPWDVGPYRFADTPQPSSPTRLRLQVTLGIP